MSGSESLPILDVFDRRHLHTKRIDLLHHHHQYPTLEHLDDPAFHRLIKEKRFSDRRIVIGDNAADTWPILQHFSSILPLRFAYQPNTPPNANVNSLEAARILLAGGEIPYAIALKDVGLVVYTGCTTRTTMIQYDGMQLMELNRWTTSAEVDRVLSWGVRSNRWAINNVKFGALSEDWTALRASAAPNRCDLGNAWNRDLPFYILSLYKAWPGMHLRDLPICLSDQRVTRNMIQRLSILGCARAPREELQGVAWVCTELGLKVFEVWDKSGKELSFNIVYLLAMVAVLQDKDPNMTPLALRVLVHMAAIAHVGI
ncbi:hypothetical protein F5Y08DRAFT_342398 [Xylaria arbuscula]|nr:hypothetical protein F5Y08DRAFT_342398 [Xylaria arbuscula]